MPNFDDISIGSLQNSTPDEKIDSIVRQANEWGRQLSNEKTASIWRASDGTVRIAQGTVAIGTTVVTGTLYYDSTNTPRIFIGLAPDDQRPGIWISKSGNSVITLLGG